MTWCWLWATPGLKIQYWYTLFFFVLHSSFFFFFFISNKIYWYKKMDTLVHRKCTGSKNQEQNLHKWRKGKKNDWFRKANNQSNKVLKKNNLRSGMDLSLSVPPMQPPWNFYGLHHHTSFTKPQCKRWISTISTPFLHMQHQTTIYFLSP